jgi:hypothetical protein
MVAFAGGVEVGGVEVGGVDVLGGVLLPKGSLAVGNVTWAPPLEQLVVAATINNVNQARLLM